MPTEYIIVYRTDYSAIMYLLVVIIFLAFCAGAIFLQVYLSRKESKWPGLILPSITLGFSLLAIFGIAAFSVFYSTETEVRMLNAERVYLQEIDILYERTEHTESPEELERIADMQEMLEQRIYSLGNVQTETNWTAVIARLAYTFVMMNIPTIVLLVIYLACRGKRRQQRALNVMSVQDL